MQQLPKSFLQDCFPARFKSVRGEGPGFVRMFQDPFTAPRARAGPAHTGLNFNPRHSEQATPTECLTRGGEMFPRRNSLESVCTFPIGGAPVDSSVSLEKC